MIISVPHPILRQEAQPVQSVNEELLALISELESTLELQRKPRGVGLSAPQVDHSSRVFTTLLEDPQKSTQHPRSVLRTFINPEIISTSKNKTFGPDMDNPYLEGCLSIPKLYGPVPRWEWVEFQFEILIDGQRVKKYETFYDFDARVMQHEHDHLNGKLFTDYILEFDLPLYEENSRGKLIATTSSIAKKF